MTDQQILEARAAFVEKIKKDEEHKDAWARASLKARWNGPLNGFASDGVNFRWQDFLDGWKAALKRNPS